MFGMDQIMKQAQEMQEKIKGLQEEIAMLEVEGQSGAGMVKVVMNGRNDVKKVDIDPDLLSEDKEMIEDLLAAAVNDAVRRAENLKAEKMRELTGGVDLPPGFKMPF